MSKIAWAGNSRYFNCRKGVACTDLTVECQMEVTLPYPAAEQKSTPVCEYQEEG